MSQLYTATARKATLAKTPPIPRRGGEFMTQGAADIIQVCLPDLPLLAARFGPSDGLCHHAEQHAQFYLAAASYIDIRYVKHCFLFHCLSLADNRAFLTGRTALPRPAPTSRRHGGRNVREGASRLPPTGKRYAGKNEGPVTGTKTDRTKRRTRNRRKRMSC